jgi:integrase
MAKNQRRSFGKIRKLPSGRFQASYVGPDLNRHTAPSTFEARIDAEEWCAARRREIMGDEWQPPKVRAHRITLDTYATSWLATRTTPKGEPIKRRTRSHYRYLLDMHILPTFGTLPLRSITPAMVRAWHAGLADTPSVRAHSYALLNAILRTAVTDDEVTKNPCQIRGASKTTRVKEIRPATIDELAAITAAMPDRMRLAIQLSAWCALRFGEVTELRRRDVDVKAGVLHIRRGVVRDNGEVIVDRPKSAAGVRDIAIPPHVLPMVRQHLLDHAQIGQDGLLFYAPTTGGQLPHSSLEWHWRRARRDAGRDDLTLHGLRHTGATMAAQAGATIKELMARLGHATPDMAMRYQHETAERDRALAERLSRMAAASDAG